MRFHEKPNWKKLRDGEMDWDLFRLRSGILDFIRQFFLQRDYLEIEAPLLTPYPTLDSHIDSIPVQVGDGRHKYQRFFLHTSPEHSMKKLIAGGASRIFFMGKVFRDNELTNLHNPEFTMLEWYRSPADYCDIALETQDLICSIFKKFIPSSQCMYNGQELDLTPPWPRVRLKDLFMDKTGIPLENALTLETLQVFAKQMRYPCSDSDDWESLFFRIYLDKVEPGLGFPKPVFIMDYPHSLSLMARRKTGDPGWVERVELYIGGLEVANGYSELLDTTEQRSRFLRERALREKQGKTLPLDNELLNALEVPLHPVAGIALGLDRLIMLLFNKKRIEDVILFPLHQNFARP
jgi:lysyl-tRNA synthetase class 2